ncbi:MAG: 50S ribosomal protein L4 [Planctomycetes bacterium]|nr:50S ribosomal protein L4 [Planctomycetota bacterium]MCB9910364.1 50S ribosomal protein L4 [Planctomycetota bacterium]MCB9912025.1 50S ribosomal protein L4 [Planctomycetota bacterium]
MQVKSYKAGNVGEVEFDTTAFGEQVLYRTLKDAVVMYQANKRQGTAATRGRSVVRGSNKKPYKQKHTGRARAGDRKSPIWRGGGTVFGPHPRDFSYHMPIKARRVALRSALAGKLADGEVVIADLAGFGSPSSKDARRILATLGSPRRACIVTADNDTNVYKSFRNFPGVNVRPASDLCALDVIAGGLIIAEQGALDKVAARVGRAAVSKNQSDAGGTL